MKHLFALLSLIVLVANGCSRNSGPPAPLPADQIAVEFKKAFSNAPQMAKELTAGVTSSLQQNDYAGAYQAINVLIGMPDLTKEQQTVAARALLTINGLVQKAKDAGDPKAAELLQMHRSSR